MISSIKTKKTLETGLIIRRDNFFSKMQRIWDTIFFKEEISILKKIEKYLIAPQKQMKNIIIPKQIIVDKKWY